jgi:hypothetical protein
MKLRIVGRGNIPASSWRNDTSHSGYFKESSCLANDCCYDGESGCSEIRLRPLLAPANGNADLTFDVGYIYTTLGDVATVTYPSCDTLPSPPAVSHGYTRGFLTAIPGPTSRVVANINRPRDIDLSRKTGSSGIRVGKGIGAEVEAAEVEVVSKGV